MRSLTTALVLAAGLLLGPAPALGADGYSSTANVTITAQGYIAEAPQDFTVTWIDDYDVALSWSEGTDANETVVRASYSDYPSGPTDGYLVYSGNSTGVNDTAVNLDETASRLYYRAWSKTSEGVYSGEYAEGWIEGAGVKIIAFVILGLGLMVMAHVFNRKPLLIASMVTWAGFSLYYLGQASGWDIYRVLSYAGMFLVLVCLFDLIMMGRKAVGTEQPAPEDRFIDQYTDYQRRLGKMRQLGPGRRRRPR